MIDRMLGAALLKAETYEDVEADRGALPQALLIVIAVSIVGAVGNVLSPDADVVNGVIRGVVGGVVLWALWALLTWIVGATIFRTATTQADWGQLARGTGFAQTPGLLNVFAFLPVVGGLVGFVVFFWRFAAMVVAVRQCLDYTSTWRAFFVILISAIPVFILYVIVGTILGVGTVTVGN